MQESVHKWREAPSHLPEDAPNILIVMLDDVGFGQASTFGGEINTPTLSRLAEEGISYNRFHTTAMCSPTRASLITGRNQHRVGSGQVAEFANDWDGYTGVIPKSSATIAEVLGHHGYATAAFGKDHNTPLDQLANGPYDRLPTGRGFDYFYGFFGGETSQWEPALWENTTPISAPHVENHEDYHLTEDLADKGITWMRDTWPLTRIGLSSCIGHREEFMVLIMLPRNGRTNTRVSLMMAGMPSKREILSVRRSWVGSLQTPSWLPARKKCPPGKMFPKSKKPFRPA